MKRILVTGGTGFIGRYLIDHLHQRGFEIHLLGRHPSQDANVVFHDADVLDVERTSHVIAAIKASHLLHLAWHVKPGEYWRSPQNLDWIAASLRLVRSFAESGGTRAVFAGTCAEYLWGAERFFETATLCRPATLYGTAKDALHKVVAAYGDIAPLSIGWGRIFFLYGPGEKPGRLVSDAIGRLLSGQEFATSHGLQKRDFMHVSDVAEAFAALADCDVRGPVNIGSGQAVSVRSILEFVSHEIGDGNLIRFGGRPLPDGDPHIIEADIGRLTEEVGFRPRYDLSTGLKDTVAWWRQQ